MGRTISMPLSTPQSKPQATPQFIKQSISPSIRPTSQPDSVRPYSRPLALKQVGLGVAVATALLLAPQLTLAGSARSEVLYKLTTKCSLNGGPALACEVEASNEQAATLYRHQIGATISTIRITDKPVTMSRWNQATKAWQPLSKAAARFSTNTICFNGSELCAVNPNYLNSVREQRPDVTAGRDLVELRFDQQGRINLSCFDSGCQEVKP
jgi:hypothetical protein